MNKDLISNKIFLYIGILFFLMLLIALINSSTHPSLEQSFQTSTWSIVAVDPISGDVGVAGASCVPDVHADALAALVPGKGAAATQAFFKLENRNRVLDLILAGNTADEIIQQVSDSETDFLVDDRQYGVVTIDDGSLTASAFTGANNPEWSGSQQNIGMGVSVQGNTLVSAAVVSDAVQAFEAEDALDRNALPDRLMRALEAGSEAGGDLRCNNDQVEQTAATAFILVARGIDKPYATDNIGLTDMGLENAPWLAISVTEYQFGPNPIIELRALYDTWREENIESTDTSFVFPLIYIVLITGVIGLFVLIGFWVKRRRQKA